MLRKKKTKKVYFPLRKIEWNYLICFFSSFLVIPSTYRHWFGNRCWSSWCWTHIRGNRSESTNEVKELYQLVMAWGKQQLNSTPSAILSHRPNRRRTLLKLNPKVICTFQSFLFCRIENYEQFSASMADAHIFTHRICLCVFLLLVAAMPSKTAALRAQLGWKIENNTHNWNVLILIKKNSRLKRSTEQQASN